MKRAAIAVALISLVTTATGPVETYPIRLSSPSHPGDTSHVSFRLARTFSQVWTDPGTTRKPVRDAFTATLDADETVDAVSPRGRPVKIAYKVTRCDHNHAEILPTGAMIVAETVDGRTAIKVNDAEPAEDVRKVLRDLLYSARLDEPTADQEFGTNEPHKIGDVWPADRQAMAQATRLPYHVTGDDFTGHAKLVDVSVVGGKLTETALLSQECHFEARPGQSGQMFKNLQMNRDITLSIPLDKPGSVRRAASKFKVTYTVVDSTGTQDFLGDNTFDCVYSDVMHTTLPPTTRPLIP